MSDVIEDLPDGSPYWWNRERSEYLLNQMSERHRRVAERMIAGRKWSYGTVFRRVRNGKSMAELRTDGLAGCLRTPRECARLMGAEDFKITVSLNQALFGFGDAVCVPVIEWIARNCLNPLWDEEYAPVERAANRSTTVSYGGRGRRRRAVHSVR